jgi:hypothetical protein
MTETYGFNTDAYSYTTEYRREALSAAFGRRRAQLPVLPNRFWRRSSRRSGSNATIPARIPSFLLR